MDVYGDELDDKRDNSFEEFVMIDSGILQLINYENHRNN
jgi:hypothetical protein